MAMTTTERQNTLGFLAKTMRQEAEKVQNPAHRERMIHNARSLSWTYRNLANIRPDIVDAHIDAAIEIIVHFASSRVSWELAS